jgi:hypothetical protein
MRLEAAKKLNDTLGTGNPEGLHAIDNGQQGLAPAGDSDTLATRQRRFQVRGTGGAERRDDVLIASFHIDDYGFG